jgi:hypothetical protein
MNCDTTAAPVVGRRGRRIAYKPGPPSDLARRLRVAQVAARVPSCRQLAAMTHDAPATPVRAAFAQVLAVSEMRPPLPLHAVRIRSLA